MPAAVEALERVIGRGNQRMVRFSRAA